MASSVDSKDYELHVLRAAADGVEPALLLTAPGRKAEYLFNVPDGFSRLALEHKFTPSARLSCVLLTSLHPSATGGLGGLLLRLKHDGHGQFQVVGPQGSSNIIHSLRHICRWQHPKVFVSECCVNVPPPVFEDEHVVIVPLLAGDESSSCPWCLYAASETAVTNASKKETSTMSEPPRDFSSSSGSSTSSANSAPSMFMQSRDYQDAADSFEKKLSEFNSHGTKAKNRVSQEIDTARRSLSHLTKGTAVSGITPVIGPTQGHGCDLKCQQNIPPHIRKRNKTSTDELLTDLKEAYFENVRNKLQKGGAQCCGEITCRSYSNEQVDKNNVASNQEEYCEILQSSNDIPISTVRRMNDITHLLPGSASNTEPLKAPLACSLEPFDRFISNCQQHELPLLADDSNPVYRLVPSGQVNAVHALEIEKYSEHEKSGDGEEDTAIVMGYVCYFRDLSKAVVIVDCKDAKFLEILSKHPALSCISQFSRISNDDEAQRIVGIHTVAAIVHLTPSRIVQSSGYQQWIHLFNTTHLIMREDFLEFGFLSSLTTLRKLNSIHQDIFPLPPNLNSYQGARKASLGLARNRMTVVDAKLCMGLKISREANTLLCPSLDHSIISTVRQVSSEPQQLDPTHDVVIAAVEVSNLHRSSPTRLSQNILQAAAVNRNLSKQKESMLSCGISLESTKIIADHNMVQVGPLQNSLDQHRSRLKYSLPTRMSVGGMEVGKSYSIQDDVGKDNDRPSSVHCDMISKVFTDKEQETTTMLEVLRNWDPTLQTAALMQAQDCVRLHEHASKFQLLFLGTGSAEPSKKRGSSGILLQIRGALGAILLDAGEGVGGQLIRKFGELGARIVALSLQCVWLSHKHGDHALGVLSLLHMRSVQSAPLMVIGPHKVGQWLVEVRDTCEAIGCAVPQFIFIHCEELSESNKSPKHQQNLEELLEAMHLQSMRTVKVFHCYDAYGVVLTGKCGWKLVYSGDTRPCNQLIEAGWGCTLLIHEATFEDVLVEQAKQKRHSTVSEAVQVGLRMQACHIILTHFSQRYPETVALEVDHKENVSLAFDGMVVPSHLLGCLGKLLPLIRRLFQNAHSSYTSTGSGQQQKGQPMATPIKHGECAPVIPASVCSYLNILGKQECPISKPISRHTRWSSDSEDDQCFEGHGNSASIRWSSDSDEDTKCFPEIGRIARQNSTDYSSETVPHLNSGDAIGPPTLIPAKDGEKVTTHVKNHFKVGSGSLQTSETFGPYGGKHVRWIGYEDD